MLLINLSRLFPTTLNRIFAISTFILTLFEVMTTLQKIITAAAAILLMATNLLFISSAAAQQPDILNNLHGDIQIDAQYYRPDSAIDAEVPPEQIGMNAYANLIYSAGPVTAGIRYEAYQPPLLGYDERYTGQGLVYRYATYQFTDLDVTVGNFYEQFGSGMIFRSFEDRGVGIDNAMDGVRIRYQPVKGVYLKALVGRQRVFFEKSDGYLRGIDGEVVINDLKEEWNDKKTKLTLGAGVTSKYQPSQVIVAPDDPNLTLDLPENVAAAAVRANLTRGNFNLYTEYAYKANDPSAVNNYIYRRGEALFMAGSYSFKGFAISSGFKRTDNMAYYINRTESGNFQTISFLPPFTRQHAYGLVASIYPYAVQPAGELGMQGELIYKFKKESTLGGKYGTLVTLHYTRINDISRESTGDRMGYTSSFFDSGKLFYSDFHVEVNKKINKKLKGTIGYYQLTLDRGVAANNLSISSTEDIVSHIGVIDLTYRLANKKSIHTELQTLQTQQHDGSWAMALIEYNVAPHWSFAVIDQYNYGNPDSDKQLHYLLGNVAYKKDGYRLAIGYGRQRAGVVCVGGICRIVPASNGMNISLLANF